MTGYISIGLKQEEEGEENENEEEEDERGDNDGNEEPDNDVDERPKRGASNYLLQISSAATGARKWVSAQQSMQYRMARRRNARLACIITGSSGHMRMASWAIARSAGKLWKPPR